MTMKSVLVRDDLLTVIAIAMLAACSSDVAHEALGHGSACLLSGQRITLLNSAFFQCSNFDRYTAMAGPLGNLTAGVVAFAAQKFISPARPALRLYALLLMAFSLFWEAGYLIQAMIKDRGDSVFAYRALIGPENFAVRVVAVVVGMLAYMLFIHMTRRRAAVFADATGRLKWLLRISWATGVAGMTVLGGLFAPDRVGAAHDAGLSIAASFPLWFVSASSQPTSETAARIARNPWIIATGLIVFVTVASTLGRGLVF